MVQNRLNPTDNDLFVMIKNITDKYVHIDQLKHYYKICLLPINDIEKQTLNAVIDAVKGRMGKRFIKYVKKQNKLIFHINYDEENDFPIEIKTDFVEQEFLDSKLYCRKLKEVYACQVKRDNVSELQHFIGNGTMYIPKTNSQLTMFEFIDLYGTIKTANQHQYILKDKSGVTQIINPQDFIKDYDLKHEEFKLNDLLYINELPRSTEFILEQIKILFDKEFGDNILTRFDKLNEEIKDFFEAYTNLIANGLEDNDSLEEFIDELSDVQAVLFHIETIFNKNPKQLLVMAMEKVIKRKYDPSYKRKIK